MLFIEDLFSYFDSDNIEDIINLATLTTKDIIPWDRWVTVKYIDYNANGTLNEYLPSQYYSYIYCYKIRYNTIQNYTFQSLTHRINGPAISIYDASDILTRSYWFQKNKLHRINGPAWIESKGRSQIHHWYVNGVQIFKTLD